MKRGRENFPRMKQLFGSYQSIDHFTWTTYAEPEQLRQFVLAFAYRTLVRRIVSHYLKQECEVKRYWKEPTEEAMGGWKIEVWVDETDTD